jgi:predicted porin
MSASFWLEAGMQNDDGRGFASNSNNQASGGGAGTGGTQGLTFNRRSTVSLAGGWGELRLGRDYTPQFWNLTVFDPFGTNGVGTTQQLNSIITGVTAVRASNTIGYFLPGNLGGFYGQFQTYRGENSTNVAGLNSNDGNGNGIRLGFANGPFNVALATSRTDYHNAANAEQNVEQSNVGGQWDFGPGQLMGQYSWDKNGSTKAKGWLIGGLYGIGAGQIRLAYSEYKLDVAGPDPKARKLAIGYVHNLSKRTAVYTTYATVKNSDGSAASVAPGAAAGPGVNASSNGFDLGIRHSF